MVTTREIFHTHNLRCTKQRTVVYNALSGFTRHPSADEIYHVLKPGCQTISKATVYNTLDTFCAAGLVRRVPTVQGTARYCLESTPHAHARLAGTGEILDVPQDLSDDLVEALHGEVLDSIEHRLGITIDEIDIVFKARRISP